MSKVDETKNHYQSVINKLNNNQSKASSQVIAWNDKVGNFATSSMTQTVNSWRDSLGFAFKSLDVSLEPLGVLDLELDKIKINLQDIKNKLDAINKNVNQAKEF